MPPYTPVKSNAQRRLLFAKANRGEIAMSEAEGKARAAKGRDLPERVGPRASAPGKRRAARKGRR